MVLALFFLVACGGCAPVEAPPVQHYAQAEALFRAVSVGELELARELGREMEAAGLDPAPPDTQEHLDRVHSGVGFLFVAEDRVEAADAVAAIGAGCGGCHAQLGVAGGPVGEGLSGAWTGLWRGDWPASLAASEACSGARGQALGKDRPDTAGEYDAQGAFAEVLGWEGGCAPTGDGLH